MHPDTASGGVLRVVVVGGGVAGLETLVALNALAGERVSATLVAPDETFALRALGVFEPFGLGRPRHYDLAELTGALGVAFARDRVGRVDRAGRRVRLRSGAELPYDALVLAVGAIPYPAFDHGVVFDRRSPKAFDARSPTCSPAVPAPSPSSCRPGRRGRSRPTSSRSCCARSAAPAGRPGRP
jgi:NADPH-dependent 2,4-dienoyl-CoA reductase/sulfur reductase-like enzyme